jgi:NAD-dependent dihydropyrimidine dehydrogenase PreA subunit
MIEIQIHEQSCRGCQICVEICPTKVFEYDSVQRRAIIRHAEDCIACLSCAYLCPSGAITHGNYHKVKNFYRDSAFCSRMEKFL